MGLLETLKGFFTPQREARPARATRTTDGGVGKHRARRRYTAPVHPYEVAGVGVGALFAALRSPAKAIAHVGEWILPSPTRHHPDTQLGSTPSAPPIRQVHQQLEQHQAQEPQELQPQLQNREPQHVHIHQQQEDHQYQQVHHHEQQYGQEVSRPYRNTVAAPAPAGVSVPAPRHPQKLLPACIDLTADDDDEPVKKDEIAEWLQQVRARNQARTNGTDLAAVRCERVKTRWLPSTPTTPAPFPPPAREVVTIHDVSEWADEAEHAGRTHDVSLEALADDQAKLRECAQRLHAWSSVDKLSADVAWRQRRHEDKHEQLVRDLEVVRARADQDKAELEAAIRADLAKLRIRPRLPPLDTDAEEMVEYAWGPGPPSELLVEKFGIPMTRGGLRRLQGLEWLNDEIINFYMKMINERCAGDASLPRVFAHQSFFYTKLTEESYDKVKRWTRKVDIFGLDYLLVPVHLGNHWCMAVADFTTKTFKYFDSLGGRNHKAVAALRRYLELEHKDKKKADLDTGDWSEYLPGSKGVPQQNNGSDCGVYACQFAEYTSRNADFDFGPNDMPYFRRRMVYEIITSTLLT